MQVPISCINVDMISRRFFVVLIKTEEKKFKLESSDFMLNFVNYKKLKTNLLA